jgi:ABC-2 type transport system ATP-binding protein
MLNKSNSARVIETFGLTRKFGSLTAVNQVGLKVPASSIYGFLGPNGAGKTTTIRMLLGLLRPTSGNVSIFGGPLRENPRLILSRIGSLVESPSLYPNLTAWENIEVVRRMRNAHPNQIDRALHIVNLQKDAARLVSQFSTGMRQRLGLAIALLDSPDLLILDEPTNGLDPAGIHEVRDLIRSLPEKEGVTVFLSSHLLNEVEQMATHIGIIQQGSLIFQGTPDELRARYQDHISIGVDQPAEAQLALTQSGWKTEYNGNHHIIVSANGDADTALVNQLLVQKGFKVYHLQMQQPSLEDIFLHLTETSVQS